uniref:WDR90/POC16 second beta-propeller domain-containing protein n=1 Tax=Globisporangium ultimum (strain ATCC 200006 / CBS 805.95 / DAOM BR144) TaxID=431595 RepID=K3WKU4_GLOUD
MQIHIWDCSAVSSDGKGGKATIIAKQTCDFPVTSIAFSPYEVDHLVSCGKENVRFWRLKKNHLTGSPVILKEYSRGTVFTDLGFDPVYQAFPSNMPRTRPLYVSSSLGTLLLIDYDTRDVVCVYQLHDAAINCLSINEGFCVTGSEDQFLRVWPLDFTDFFLEAQHEAGVASAEVSLDGLKVLVGSCNGAIGVLDISDQRYDTILRSHRSEITAMTLTPISIFSHDETIKKDEIVTTSLDGTLRIWDVVSGQQSYEFDVQKDAVTCLVVSPVENGVIAVGFASGCSRIFDMKDGSMTSVLCEFQQHQSSICSIQYDRDSEFLYTSATGQQLCMYDARQREYAPLKMLIVDMYPGHGIFSLSSNKKYIAMISNDQQRVVLLYARSLQVCTTIKPSRHLQQQQHYPNNETTKDELKDLVMSSDASELLALSKTDRLFVYSMHTMQLLQTIPLLGQQSITSLILSPNMKYMATGGSDGSVRIWRWDEKQRFNRVQQCFLGQTGELTRVCFTSDGKFIVATGSSSTIFIWDFHGESGCPNLPCLDQLSPVKPKNDGASNSYGLIPQTLEQKQAESSFSGYANDGSVDPEALSPSLNIPI